MADTNKVRFGIKNCYYSIITRDENNVPTFATPVALPGAVNLSLSPNGSDPEPFYADDITYYMVPGINNGYSGTLELAKIPDSFHKDVLGDIEDANGLLLENADAVSKEFALLTEFKGDKMATRHAIYCCTATRSDFGSSTIEETATPQTETLNLSSIPIEFSTTVGEQGSETVIKHMIVKAKANQTDSTEQYNAWFDTVQVPEFTAEA